jgi:hypothetical protein
MPSATSSSSTSSAFSPRGRAARRGHDLALAVGHGLARPDLADQRGPDAGALHAVRQLGHEQVRDLVRGGALQPVRMRVVHVEAAAGHDVQARALGDARQLSHPPSDPDDREVDQAGAARCAHALELAHGEVRVVDDQVVLQAREVPAHEAEVLHADPLVGRARLARRLQPHPRVDQQVLVHVRAAQRLGSDGAQHGLDRHGRSRGSM